MRLAGKVAIVTASGRGIGRAIAICLAKEGADIVISSFHEETTAITARTVEALGRKTLEMPGDITTTNVITQVVQETLDTFGRIDILINNVGAGRIIPKEPGDGPLGQLEVNWDGAYEQNLKAPVLMSEAVAPYFIQQMNGKILNISSIAGRVSLPEKLQQRVVSQSYSAMKAALISYTQTLAERLGPYNINVNCVCPGIVYTDAWKRHSKRMVETVPAFRGQDAREWFMGIAQGKYPDMFSSTPLRREQTVEDIGRSVVYLTSEDARNITGQTLNVDGGMVKN